MQPQWIIEARRLVAAEAAKLDMEPAEFLHSARFEQSPIFARCVRLMRDGIGKQKEGDVRPDS